MTIDKQKAFDSFNDHQKDNRGRATLLASYALALAAGSFTASITVFSSRTQGSLSTAIVKHLHDGWFSLFLSMASLFLFLVLMIVRDYLAAEVSWRPRLHGKAPYLNENVFKCCAVIFEFVLIAAGLFGLGVLCYGLYNIMEAACALVA